MAEYTHKWHNETSLRIKCTETSDGVAAIQAQLNNLGREIKKEEGKTLEEAYYTQFGAPYQPEGQYKAAGPGFYQLNNRNSSYLDWRTNLEESLTKFMVENSNIIKEIRASTDAAIRNQGALIKTLEIQIGQMSKVLQERGFGSMPSSMKKNPRDQVKSISTAKANFSEICRIGCGLYAQDVKILDAYDHTLPQKEKDPRSFTLPCFIHNICFDKALVDLGANDKDEGKSHARTLIDIPVFVRSFSIISGFTIIDDDDMTKDVVLGMKFCMKYASCQMIMKKFALGDKCEQIMEDKR
ncbi:hypothetical protein Tco_1072804 [Tanacetum coccineum]